MKSFLLKYKLVFKFIITFVAVYSVLTLGYNYYLSMSSGTLYYPDFATNLVARQTDTLLESVGYSTVMEPHPNEPSVKIIINGKFVATIVEGCNAISIIILFLSFIFAFSSSVKSTLLYAFAGSIIIYAFNLIRIVILAIGLYHYPWRREVLHTVIFPLLIYGTVFLLWMIWVNRFAKSKEHV